MMIRVCDRCGQPLDNGTLRYIAKIQVYAAYDPLEITFEDLNRDYSEEIQQVVKQCEGVGEKQLMDSVYVDFEFDLCPGCQREYIKQPICVKE